MVLSAHTPKKCINNSRYFQIIVISGFSHVIFSYNHSPSPLPKRLLFFIIDTRALLRKFSFWENVFPEENLMMKSFKRNAFLQKAELLLTGFKIISVLGRESLSLLFNSPPPILYYFANFSKILNPWQNKHIFLFGGDRDPTHIFFFSPNDKSFSIYTFQLFLIYFKRHLDFSPSVPLTPSSFVILTFSLFHS